MLKNIISLLFVLSLFLPLSVKTDTMRQIFSDPNYIEAFNHFNNREYKKAHRMLKALDERFPDNSVILNNLGVISTHLGNMGQAEKLFERAIIVNQYVAVGYQNLQKLYMHQAAKNYRDALVLDEQQVSSPLNVEFITATTKQSKPKKQASLDQSILKIDEVNQPLVVENKDASMIVADSMVKDFVLSWASAWSRQDLDAYFSHYVTNYQPRKTVSHKDWSQMRKQRISVPNSILVKVSQIRMKNSKDKTNVIFNQSYKTSKFNSLVVKKLTLEKTTKGWKISKERVIQRKK